MRFFKKKVKTRKDILTEEMLRFKKRVEKRFGYTEDNLSGPFVEPFVSWYSEVANGIEWNDVHIKMFFSTDESDMGIVLQV
jgi:hypothetical protein